MLSIYLAEIIKIAILLKSIYFVDVFICYLVSSIMIPSYIFMLLS